MNRRDVILGAGCVAALAGAEALRPRTLMSLMGDRKLADIIPMRFGSWFVDGQGDIVVPKTPGSLASTLYNETVTRNYRNADGGPAVMLLAAHGDSQSDLLQLHRPESCYQAIGFAITDRRFEPVPLAQGTTLPATELTAESGPRIEDLLYWTRLGERFPRTAGEQRSDRLKTAMEGFVADGVLVRMSMFRNGDAPDFERLKQFAAAMVGSIPPAARPSLIGTARARDLRAVAQSELRQT